MMSEARVGVADMAERVEIEALERQRLAFHQVRAVLNPFPVTRDPPTPLPTNCDWEAAYDFAAFHGVRPALQRAIARMGTVISDGAELCETQSNFQRAHVFRVMQMTSEIVRLAQAFDRVGINALFFKGAVLAEQAYGGIQNREFNDIDVLVVPAQSGHAEEVLSNLGFYPTLENRQFRSTFFDHHGQHNFKNSESSTIVDFHWKFVGAGPFPVSVKDAVRNSVIMNLGGAKIRVPAPEEHALILAGHGQKENWASFGWILDFATFASVNPALNWSAVAMKARSRKCILPVLTAHSLVERIFEFTIDDKLAAQALSHSAVADLVDRVVAKMVTLARRQLADDLVGGFRLCETPIQSVQVALRMLTDRTIGDYEAMPLGDSWWWLYRATRPLRLAFQAVFGRSPGMSEDVAQRGVGASKGFESKR